MANEGTGFLPRVLTIARNAFREAVRDRILYNLIVFVLLITVSAIFLGELTAGQEARVIVNLGLSATLVFGTFIAIFVGVSLVWKEIEKKTVYSIFSKPVGRGEWIIGKYLGLCATLLVNLAVMGAGVTLALRLCRRRAVDRRCLGGGFVDLSRTDSHYRSRDHVFVIFDTGTLGVAYVFCLYYRPFQRLSAQCCDECRVAVVHRVFHGDLLYSPKSVAF